jgi:hypothetical protein
VRQALPDSATPCRNDRQTGFHCRTDAAACELLLW